MDPFRRLPQTGAREKRGILRTDFVTNQDPRISSAGLRVGRFRQASGQSLCQRFRSIVRQGLRARRRRSPSTFSPNIGNFLRPARTRCTGTTCTSHIGSSPSAGPELESCPRYHCHHSGHRHLVRTPQKTDLTNRPT